MEEIRVDMRKLTAEDSKAYDKQEELLFRLNQTFPRSEEYKKILGELFKDRIGEGSFLRAPLAGAALDKMIIGNGVFINSNLLAMARGGITIEDDVMIAANVQLLSNNHDPYDRHVLTCRPIVIKKGAWIGAGASILPGVTVGRYAIVGASSVVTKDVPDYGVVVGSPAKVIKMLDADKFK
ncbi:galactoside O-acetyltransferase [bacterium]|nr:galactoside O-acetyltransferase [bacterium]